MILYEAWTQTRTPDNTATAHKHVDTYKFFEKMIEFNLITSTGVVSVSDTGTRLQSEVSVQHR